jgi:hypothetical protein
MSGTFRRRRCLERSSAHWRSDFLPLDAGNKGKSILLVQKYYLFSCVPVHITLSRCVTSFLYKTQSYFYTECGRISELIINKNNILLNVIDTSFITSQFIMNLNFFLHIFTFCVQCLLGGHHPPRCTGTHELRSCAWWLEAFLLTFVRCVNWGRPTWWLFTLDRHFFTPLPYPLTDWIWRWGFLLIPFTAKSKQIICNWPRPNKHFHSTHTLSYSPAIHVD